MCVCGCVCVADAASARLLLATVTYAFSARGGAASHPAARETEGVAEAVHTIKTLLFLNIHPFNLMNAAQASKCRPVSEIITETDRIAFSIFYSEMQSPFCISFGNQGPRVWRKSGEAQNPCFLKSSVKFPQLVMIWAAMSSAGVGPLCFLKSTVNLPAIYQEILEHFTLPSADKLYEMLVSFSSRTWHLPTLPKVSKADSMTMVLLCLIGQQTRLT